MEINRWTKAVELVRKEIMRSLRTDTKVKKMEESTTFEIRNL